MMIKLLPTALLCFILISFVSSTELEDAKEIATNFASHLRASSSDELHDIIAPGATFYHKRRLNKPDFLKKVERGTYSDLQFSTYDPIVTFNLAMTTFKISFMNGSRLSFSVDLGYAQNRLSITSGSF
ncbi:uncharacterized protein MELLADRAFT_123583 [Melampsora larici-populina 98AG31]|uniref:Secreted protein n=1 Tax=Melampsora larici-populina (strain 98AG31 / pathotype 3-4-7) TaxID=747676 RepID=F4R8B4_MELLP|nr:uncharacterized protein MELLADRAFT_123583 [Melampsora larici-populina 98AG31]EGG11639.1 secreted protein [Melampsora larici-populina 98AG31]